MELREYQKKVIARLSEYVSALNNHREQYKKALKDFPELAKELHYPKKAWEEIGLRDYFPASNGIGEPLPHLYLKVPTGGGKTLLACSSIDLINRVYLQKQTGLVLWIVPTSQIYSQTLKNLRDRTHPYRQVLDVSSGGKTLVLEKLDRFNVDDVQNNLCIMLLMLPSAARQNKETLKVFQDNTGYTSFFPDEDAYKEQEALLEAVPNLDTFGEKGYIFGSYPKTSLGNVLRLCKPITIVDEGHKAYSENARKTIYGFNPSFVLELSATPPQGVNKLIEITGNELNDEQMIKLDLHLTNKNTSGWEETLSEAAAMREELENTALKYEQNTNKYIRPIMLIQVERTGKDQRDGKLIHAEDAKEYLIKQLSVPEEDIAIKSSSKDDIEGIDLLSRESTIRFIITKQALQEGWDCPFAYVLCALGKSQSETAMTQLIGRILRQPYAQKSGVKQLDECYVYTFQQNTSKLVGEIKKNLENEGLGDIVGRISVDGATDENADYEESKTTQYREQFRKFEGRIYLPVFAIQEEGAWREVSYETDLLAQVDWNELDLSSIGKVSLSSTTRDDDVLSVGFSGGELSKTDDQVREYESDIHVEDIARRIVDLIPNPWVAYSVANRVIDELLGRYDKEVVASNFVHVIEELRTHVFKERDALSYNVFKNLLDENKMKFYLLEGETVSQLPKSVHVRSKRRLTHADGEQIQQSLFDYVPSEGINELEEEVALYLDKQDKLLWWYRNMARAEYRIQGWRPHRVYPDFIAAHKKGGNETADTYDKVFVFETKGDHLAHNLDTDYKRALLKLCSELAVEKSWSELDLGDDTDFTFEMVDEQSWKSQLNALVGS